jgi:hypothetical protein
MGGEARSRSANGHRCHPQGFRGCHKGATLPSCKDSLSRLQDLSLIKRATANTARLTHDQAGRASLIICDGLGFPLVESRSVRVHK